MMIMVLKRKMKILSKKYNDDYDISFYIFIILILFGSFFIVIDEPVSTTKESAKIASVAILANENKPYKEPEQIVETTTTTVVEEPVEIPTTTVLETTTIPETTTTIYIAPPVTEAQINSGIDAFLACVRAHESDTAGGYSAVNPSSGAGGAYQFLQSTWNNVAANAGRSDLIGIHPSQASPADQDAMAIHLYNWQGASPWAGSGCY